MLSIGVGAAIIGRGSSLSRCDEGAETVIETGDSGLAAIAGANEPIAADRFRLPSPLPPSNARSSVEYGLPTPPEKKDLAAGAMMLPADIALPVLAAATVATAGVRAEYRLPSGEIAVGEMAAGAAEAGAAKL